MMYGCNSVIDWCILTLGMHFNTHDACTPFLLVLRAVSAISGIYVFLTWSFCAGRKISNSGFSAYKMIVAHNPLVEFLRRYADL